MNPLAISTAPQEAYQGTFKFMICAGLPSQSGSWVVHKEAAVLSQIANQWYVQSQLPQDNGCCPTRYSCHSEKGWLQSFCPDGQCILSDYGDTIITFVKGDANSGDTLVSCFGGNNCIARESRMFVW